MRAAAGFSLVEVVVATAVVMTGVVSLAQLFAVSADANRLARETTTAVVLAQGKIEELRATATALSPSPPGTLSVSTAGYLDYIDRWGLPLAGAPSASPGNAVFIRRWAIAPLPGPGHGLVLQVRVLPRARRGLAGDGNTSARVPAEVHLVSVKTRMAG